MTVLAAVSGWSADCLNLIKQRDEVIMRPPVVADLPTTSGGPFWIRVFGGFRYEWILVLRNTSDSEVDQFKRAFSEATIIRIGPEGDRFFNGN